MNKIRRLHKYSYVVNRMHSKKDYENKTKKFQNSKDIDCGAPGDMNYVLPKFTKGMNTSQYASCNFQVKHHAFYFYYQYQCEGKDHENTMRMVLIVCTLLADREIQNNAQGCQQLMIIHFQFTRYNTLFHLKAIPTPPPPDINYKN